MTTWIEKYKPTRLTDVVCDKSQIYRLNQFINQFNDADPETINPNLIISGKNGIGKTLIVDLLLQERGLEKTTIDLSKVSIQRKNKKRKNVECEANGPKKNIHTVYKLLQNIKYIADDGAYQKKDIVLVIDDVSNITNPKEKDVIKTLVKMNNKFKKFPIIIIANIKHNKTVNELIKIVTYTVKVQREDGKRENVKQANVITLKAPTYNEMTWIIKTICKREQLKIIDSKSDEDDIFIAIINHSQFDIRRLINMLEELKLLYTTDVTYDKFQQYIQIAKIKDIDPGIYEATRILLNRYTTIEDALILYGDERATIPLMVHENYPLNIKKQYAELTTDNQINLLYDISKCISESDKVDGLIYSNQCWNLQIVHGFYSCVMPSFYINQFPNKACKPEWYKYTRDFNKISIKKINNKVIKKAQENQFLKRVSVEDFLNIASILKTLFEKKDFHMIADLMRPYGLTLKQIESIIKIDKIKKTKIQLTGKQKTLLKDLLTTQCVI